MKRSFSYYVTFAIAFAAAFALTAATGHAGCDIRGSWVSFDGEGIPQWLCADHGGSAAAGTIELEYPDLDVTANGSFPTAVRISHFRGAWERTGGNTFDYTFMAYAVDASGAPVYIDRISGTGVLSEDCNTMEVAAFNDIFIVGIPSCDNPFEDEPCSADIDLGVFTAHRVEVE